MKTKKFAAAGIAGAASLALAFGAAGTASAVGSLDGLLGGGSLGSLGGEQCGTTAVTQDDLVVLGDDEREADVPAGTWYTPSDENPAAIQAADDDARGTGVLGFGQDGAGTSLYQASDLKLKGLKDLDKIEYTYTAIDGDSSVSNTPALQIRILNAPTEGGFATIVWSPKASDGAWGIANPTANSEDGTFWVTRTLNSGEENEIAKGQRTTLDNIIGAAPEADILGIGVQQTRDNDSTGVAVNTFTVGCETTDFELEEPEAGGSLAGIFGSLESLGGN